MRRRRLLFSLGAILIGALVLVGLTDSLLVDLLWFTERFGYRGVFTTTLGAEIAIFVLVWVVTFLAISVSGIFALRFSRERRSHLGPSTGAAKRRRSIYQK